MNIPSSSNVTGRRKRTIQDDDDDDADSLSRSTPLRKVRGKKRMNQADIASETLMDQVNAHVDEIVNKKKVGSTNCFEFKSPLELYGIEEMIAANASIQDMAVVLDGANQVIAYRVDRLLADVRSLDTALCNGDVARGQQGSDSVNIHIDDRKLKKKMAINDGFNNMTGFFEQMGLEDMEREERERLNPEEEEEPIAGETMPDPKANSLDVDAFLQSNICIDDLINEISIKRANQFKMALNNNVSAFVSPDDTAHDIKDTSVDWLRSNPTFQKATKGSLDNTANSFHSLNYYGMHSPSGRALILHPRIVDEQEGDTFYPSDVTASLAKNTCGLLENALERKPKVLHNYLMLEVKERPVVGRYKIIGKDTKKSTLPLTEASREQDLANLTFAEMNRAVAADTTISGSSDMSMLAGQDLPLSRGALDQTIVLGSSNMTIARTVSTSNRLNEEYILPAIDELGLEESLIGKVKLDPINTTELNQLFEEKFNTMKTSHAPGDKVWKNGMRAEEWGENDEVKLKSDTRNAILAGIDGWIKGTDSWTNYEVVKMNVNKEARAQLEQTVTDEQDVNIVVPDIQKNIFLMKSDDYMNSYQTDRHVDLSMVGVENDKTDMWKDDEKSAQSMVQQRIAEQQNQDLVEPALDDFDDRMEYDDGGGYDVGFDDHLAAPVELDVIEQANNREDNGSDANILFNDQIDDIVNDAQTEQDIQRQIEQIATGDDEVAELMTSAPPPQLVGPTAEMREEIRNAGRADNAHWVPPELADQDKQAAALLQRKRREKKAKNKKATIEDYVHYFREIPDDELERDMTIQKCERINDEKSTFLSEQQLYLPSLGIENKPHIAFELGLLGSSGLFFKKSYGKIRLERTKQQAAEVDLTEDSKGSSDSDCLNWLLTFSGFKCMETVEVEAAPTVDDLPDYQPPEDDYVNDIYGEDFYDPHHGQEAVALRMGPLLQKKFVDTTNQITRMLPNFHYKHGEFADSDDEFDDSFDRQSIQAKNLDAAKHKKCISDILRNEKLSMPSIQYALETLTLNQSMHQNDTSGAGTSDETARPTTPSFEADKTLTSVFDYHSPKKLNVTVQDVMLALTDYPEYQLELDTPDDQPTTSSQYGTANTENRKVKIQGCHTLLSLSLSMPTRMQEVVRPSSIVSFLLHIANENNLRIIQDRSKRSWMSDFIVLNSTQALPRGIKMGRIEEQGDFWKRTQDPDAIEGTSSDNTIFSTLIHRPKAVPVRKNRGGAAAAQRAETPELDVIQEDEEMDA